MKKYKHWIVVSIILGFGLYSYCCRSMSGGLTKENLHADLIVTARHLDNAALIMEDPAFVLELQNLAAEMRELAEQVSQMEDPAAASSLAQLALDVTDPIMQRDDLPDEAKLALFTARGILIELAAAHEFQKPEAPAEE